MKKITFLVLGMIGMLSVAKAQTTIYSEPFGDWNSYNGDASLFTHWTTTGTTKTGQANIIWPNKSTGNAPVDGTALSVPAGVTGANGLTLSGINITGYTTLSINFNFGHHFYWDNQGISANRPKISYKIDGGSWVTLTTADNTSGTWPTVDAEFNVITYSLGSSTGDALSILIEGGTIDYIIDNLVVQGTSSTSAVQSTTNDILSIYPNPTTDYINFPKSEKVQVLDLSGKLVLADANTEKLSVGNLANGLYLLKVVSNGQSQVAKFQKK